MTDTFDSFDDFNTRLKEIEAMGYVKNHRSGNTGIGKTLEDLLGIEENNVPGPDTVGVELKSTRRNSGGLKTLFCKEPPDSEKNIWTTEMVKKLGYEDSKGRQALKVTVRMDEYNNQGWRLTSDEHGISVEHQDYGVTARYPYDYLRDTYENKIPKMVFVKADVKTIDGTEHFWYNEGYYLDGFDTDEFLDMMRESVVTLDFRMHLRSNGTSTRNRGTAWRIKDFSRLDRAFDERKQLIDGRGRTPEITEDPQQELMDF